MIFFSNKRFSIKLTSRRNIKISQGGKKLLRVEHSTAKIAEYSLVENRKSFSLTTCVGMLVTGAGHFFFPSICIFIPRGTVKGLILCL